MGTVKTRQRRHRMYPLRLPEDTRAAVEEAAHRRGVPMIAWFLDAIDQQLINPVNQ